jgi:hypothetical protein
VDGHLGRHIRGFAITLERLTLFEKRCIKSTRLAFT